MNTKKYQNAEQSIQEEHGTSNIHDQFFFLFKTM